MVLVKNEPEGATTSMTHPHAPNADSETQGESEICLSDRNNKGKERKGNETPDLVQSKERQLDLHVSITRPGIHPKDNRELAQEHPSPSCPVCSYRCWNCRTESPPPSDPASVDSSASMDRSNSTMESTRHPAKKRKLNDARIYVGPKDVQFVAKIMQPCGLELRIRGPTALVKDTVGVPQNPTRSNVILDLDDQQLFAIAMDINSFHYRRYDENSLAFLLVDSLLKRDPFIAPGGSKATISLRRDKWRIQQAGPRIPENQYYYYDWDIEPDATYMVSTHMFDHHQRGEIAMAPELSAEPHGVCPYLTVEYKSVAKGGIPQDAVNQVAAASIVWLDQRRNLRKRIGSPGYIDLKHYSFIFASNHVIIWQASCTGNGYLLRELDECSLVTSEGLRKFISGAT